MHVLLVLKVRAAILVSYRSGSSFIYVQHALIAYLFPPSTVDSMVNLTTSLITDSVVILEWTLPPLATLPPNIEPPTPESAFDVYGYFIYFNDTDPVYLEGRDSTSYLFNEQAGVSPGPITFAVRVNYSRAEINDNIPGESTLFEEVPETDGKYLNSCVLRTLISNTAPVISLLYHLTCIQVQVPSLALLWNLNRLPM